MQDFHKHHLNGNTGRKFTASQLRLQPCKTETKMADTRAAEVGDVVDCNDRCGCPSPCPGGVACRCTASETTSGTDHKRCSCGEHCGCNPCTCSKAEVAGTGKLFCKCGTGCTCVTCAS